MPLLSSVVDSVVGSVSGPIFTSALFFSIIFPYCFYCFVYRHPTTALRLMSQDTIIRISTIVKEVTLVLYAIECLRCPVNWGGALIGAPCVLVGQLLNYLVMHKLGRVKAWYGWELSLVDGERLTEFPFRIGHAQYRGLILCIFGLWCLFTPTLTLTVVTALWMGMYFFIALVESSPSGRKQ